MMPRHVDLTANIERTSEEKLRIYYNLDEINAVIEGYPELNQRLFVPEDERLPARPSVILGREVTIYDIPAGFDATNVQDRTDTIAGMKPENFLFGPPDVDLPTGGDWSLTEADPAIRRAITDGCRDFTQHMQPLVPGWKQLLALKAPDGRDLGMPTGIGWYTHYWLSKMCDAVTMRLSKEGDDIDVLLYERAPDNQSEWVWATPGGFVIAADAQHTGATPLQAASARRTSYWAQRDVSAHSGVPLTVKYPISSGNTLVAGLATTPYARFIAKPDYRSEANIVQALGGPERAAGFISLRSLCEYNPMGGVSGSNHGTNPFPIWTTHFEYITAGLDALIDPENQYRFRMTDSQLHVVQGVVEDLQATYPMLQAA